MWISSNEVDETVADYTEWSKTERKTPIQYTNTYIWNQKDGNDNPVCQTAKETQMYRTVFGFCGRGRGWDDFGEWHWNMYNIICEMNHQSRYDAWYRMLRAGALGWPRGLVWGERWEGGSGWGTRVHPWYIHVDVWQNQYNIVISLQLK